MYFYIIIQRFNFVVSRIPEVTGDEFIVDKHEIEVFYESKEKFPTLNAKKRLILFGVSKLSQTSREVKIDILTFRFIGQLKECVFCLNSGQRHNITVKTTET